MASKRHNIFTAQSEWDKHSKNCRPITCLSITYKLLTSIITERTCSFLEQKESLPCEQKGCWKRSYGCKEQLLINRMIIENCDKKKRSLSTAWVHYCKVFDSVPHSWNLKALDIYKVSPVIINFLKNDNVTILWDYIIQTDKNKSKQARHNC